MTRWYILLTALALLTGGLIITSCGDGDGIDFEDGLSGQVTIPLLPFDLPIFPTDVTLDGLVDTVMDFLDDELGFLFTGDEDDIEDLLEDIEERLRDASLEILNPGVLSVAIDNKITDAITDLVKVTRVGVNFEIGNETDDFVSVPTEFKLYLGEASLAETWSESATIPFADDRVDNGQFVLEPGDTIDLSIENVPHLVDALNNLSAIGLGYKSLYRAADTSNGADSIGMLKEFGLCLLGAYAGSFSQCPSPSELLGWKTSIKKFELVIEAEADFDIPDLEDCSEFADQFGLDLLADACP
jgi:hypothetical protein